VFALLVQRYKFWHLRSCCSSCPTMLSTARLLSGLSETQITAPDFEKVGSLLRDAFGSSTIIHFSIGLGLVIKDDLGPSLVSCFDVGIIPQDLCVSNGLQAVNSNPMWTRLWQIVSKAWFSNCQNTHVRSMLCISAPKSMYD
jgi:hypothetical protein